MRDGWKSCSIGDLLEVHYGKDHKALKEGLVPAYGSAGLMRYVERPLSDKPSILIPRKGTLNNVMFSMVPFWTVDTMFWCTILDDARVDLKFLYYWLRRIDFLALNVGSAVPSTTVPTIKGLQISLPPLPTQRRIAAVLGALDDKIELNRKMNANLEAQAQALFKSWFVDFEPFGGKMPKGWKDTPLSDIAVFYPGYSYTSAELMSSRLAMATIKNFERGGGFKLDGFKEIVPSAKLKDTQCVDVFDTVVAHTDMTQNADIVGNAEIVLSNGGYDKLIASTDLVRVLPKRGVSRFLIAALLKNPVFKAHCLGYVNGTTVLHMKKSALAEYRLQLPGDMSILDGVVKRFESIYLMIAKNINESRKLAELRDALLPKLMSGELSVEEVA